MCVSGDSPTTEKWKTVSLYACVRKRFSNSSSPILSLTRRGPTWEWASRGSRKLPRKEVIQPHLPVRLPCYDFTPITDPTLDACLPDGLAQRLQVLPTFVV